MISATNKVEIVCQGCLGTTEVEATQFEQAEKYGYCPLCGSDKIDVSIRQ